MPYPEKVSQALEKAATNVFNSQKQLLEFSKEQKKILVTFTDDLLEKKWVLDMTDFTHPQSIGISGKDLYSRFRVLDVTAVFNKSSHGNGELEQLLLKSIGILTLL